MGKRNPKQGNQAHHASAVCKKSPATEYELLVCDVLKAIFGRDKKALDVRHDMKLPTIATDSSGKPVVRQADVYAEFADQQALSLVVQAKNWKSPIQLPTVDSLSGMLASLAQKHQGMLVTSSRFQRGAVLVAKQQGLELCVLRRTTPADFSDGKVPEINGHIRMIGYYSDKVQIRVPTESFCNHEIALKELGKTKPADVLLYDEAGQNVGTMDDLHSLIHRRFHRSRDYDCEQEFEVCVPLFVHVNDQPVRILSISGRFSGRELCRKSFANKISHVFGSLNSGDIFLVDMYRRVLKPGEDLSAETEAIDMKEYFPHWFGEESSEAAS